MDKAFLFWVVAIALGCVAGRFFTGSKLMKVLPKLVLSLIAGFVLSAILGWESGVWFFGVLLMAVPTLGALFLLGTFISDSFFSKKR